MFADLTRAVLAAMAAGVLPGYFWALVLCPASGLAERFAYSTVLSMASVPALAILLAQLTGAGVTLWVALGSVAVVLGSGALAFVLRGAASRPAGPVLPQPPKIRDTGTLVLMSVALAIALAMVVHLPASGALLVAAAAALALAGALAARATRPVWAAEPAGSAGSAEEGGSSPSVPAQPAGPGQPAGPAEQEGRGRLAETAWQRLALAVVLALIVIRAYVPVIRYDWPYIRGGDQFSYLVMLQQMLAHGSYGDFMTYPPGFPAMTAVVSRFSGVTPLAIFPVLAPFLLGLCALGAYALATRLWGHWYGVIAAALSGLVLHGEYTGLTEGRYPDLTAAFFLMVMLVAALITFYQSPSARSGLLVTVVGASVVLYHPVASLYAVGLLAVVALIGLPYLLRKRRRRDAGALLLTLVTTALLSACYAAYIYHFGSLLAGSSSTASVAVTSDIGTQSPRPPIFLVTELGPAILWLGIFGLAALLVGLRYLRTPSQVLAVLTVVMWCVMMYAGSRTSVDGFPWRFERDVGAPMVVTGTFGIGLILASLPSAQEPRRALAWTGATAAAVLTVAVGVLPAAENLLHDIQAQGNVLSRPVAAAGMWLRNHNTGGTIITTPGMNQGITNRAVLAMGDYTGLQSYFPRRIAHPRTLPPAGRQPLIDSREMLMHPGTCESAGIVARHDVRYVVLYKFT
ncbi:MAG: hypothetical protein J2P32_04395, partial [Actinobacteria bacterium]|nr:hypothetical protein [Actinomycetota bacterium]